MALLVTGGSGQLAGLILEELLKLPGQSRKVITTTRTPEKLSGLTARGVEVRKADFNDPASLVEAFRGAERLLLVSVSSVVPGERARQEGAAVEAAAKAGVKHIIYSSVLNATLDSDLPLAREYAQTELNLKKFPGTHTVLNASWWIDSYYRIALPGGAKFGQVLDASGGGRSNFVHRADHAAVAARVLASDFTGHNVVVCGPEALTIAEVVALANEVAGLSMKVVPMSPDEKVAALKAAGVPDPFIGVIVGFDRVIAQGRLQADPTDTARWLGRAPASVRTFLQHKAAELRTEAGHA